MILKKLRSLFVTLSAWDSSDNIVLAHTKNNSGVEYIEGLLRKGYTPNISDSIGRTPLMHAAGNGNNLSVSMLIYYGADVTKIDNWGRSALHYAAGLQISSFPIFAKRFYANEKGGGYEVPKGADYEGCIIHLCQATENDINLQDGSGDTALKLAAGHPELLSALLKFSPNRSLKNKEGKTALDIAEHF